MSVRVEFRWPEELLERVDAAAGDVPRSVWVRRAVEVALARADGSLRVAAEREVAEKFGLHPPAEQPEIQGVVPHVVSRREQRVSPSEPVSPRVPSPEPEIPAAVHERFRALSPRRDVKPFQRGDK